MRLLTMTEIAGLMERACGSMPEGEIDKLASKTEPVSLGPFTLYPDFSRSINAIAVLGFLSTSADSPVCRGISLTMPRGEVSGARIRFTDGDSFPENSHNYIEFDYVARGKFHIRIEGEDRVFNRGELLLLNRGTPHAEVIRHREAMVFRIQIANSFFDRTLRIEQGRGSGDDFLHRFILNNEHDFSFVRLIPGRGAGAMPPFFREICTEFLQPLRGSYHIIIGYVERFLDALPVKYDFEVGWSGGEAKQAAEFESIRAWLEREYRHASLAGLVKKFGHGVNYYSRLFRSRTGQTFCRYLRDLRLENAARLLVTTQFPIDEIARQTGYKSSSHFHTLFVEKFHIPPGSLREQPLP